MTRLVNDWRIELIQAYPDLFHPRPGDPPAAQGWPEVGDGWRDLLERLTTRIEAAIAEGGGSLRIRDVPEKYGTFASLSAVSLQTSPGRKSRKRSRWQRPGLPAPARNAAKKVACIDMAGCG